MVSRRKAKAEMERRDSKNLALALWLYMVKWCVERKR